MKTRSKKGIGVLPRPYTTWKSGRADDLGDTYFRSSWERNYARYLNFLIKNNEIVKWEFEPETFWFNGVKRGVVSYLPDFKVYLKNDSIEYHEVKGWMDSKSATKLKRMAKYHPSIKIILIDSKAYRAISKFKKLIPYWE